MRTLALLIALFVICIGVTGVFFPDALMAMRRYVETPGGLYAVAVLRVVIGIVLIRAARISRAPNALRVFGAIALVAGILTPVFGVERTRAVLDWEAAQGNWPIRIGAVLALLGGSFIAFAVTTRRRHVTP